MRKGDKIGTRGEAKKVVYSWPGAAGRIAESINAVRIGSTPARQEGSMISQSIRGRKRRMGFIAVSLLLLTTASRAPRLTADAKLIIWPRMPNSLTGATFDVSIDGNSKGSISNLNQQEILSLGTLSDGVHTFDLTNVQGYSIDAVGKSTRTAMPTGTCQGQFRATPFQTYYFVGVTTTDGHDLRCQIM